MALLLFAFFYEETKYIPVIPASNTSHIVESFEAGSDKDKGDSGKDAMEVNITIPTRSLRTDIPRKTYWQRMSLTTTSPGGLAKFFRHTYQPFIILFTIPAVTYTALIYGSLLAWFSVALTVLSIYFTLPPYNFSSAGIGLLNLAPFIGAIFGSAYGGFLSDYTILQLSRRNRGIFEPEMRLWLAVPAMILTPAGYFMFGFSVADVSNNP